MKKKKLLSIAILFSCSGTYMLYSSEVLINTQVDNFSEQNIDVDNFSEQNIDEGYGNYDDNFYEDEDGYSR